MFKTTIAVLREQLREANRREREKDRVIADLHDRLAHAYGQDWNLSPAQTTRSMVRDDVDDDAPYLVEL